MNLDFELCDHCGRVPATNVLCNADQIPVEPGEKYCDRCDDALGFVRCPDCDTMRICYPEDASLPMSVRPIYSALPNAVCNHHAWRRVA